MDSSFGGLVVGEGRSERERQREKFLYRKKEQIKGEKRERIRVEKRKAELARPS
jgi:hypothetical protein